MMRIVHIVDDTTLGGVTRTLDVLQRRLGEGFANELLRVPSGTTGLRLPGVQVAVVHLSAAWSRLPLMASIASNRRLRTAIVEHTYTAAFERLEVPSRLRFRAMLRITYGLAGQVVAVSEGQAAWIRRAKLAPARRIKVIRPASDCGHLLVLPPPAPHAGPLRLGAMGRLSREKGFDLLIAAMRQLPPGLATLEVAGAGPEGESLAAAAAGVPGVRLVGPVTDHLRWLGQIDALVIPSRRESFGLVALEARTAARPVIVTAVDGLPEQLAEGGGICVAPERADLIADAIVRLAAADRSRMAADGRRSALGHVDETVGGWRALLGDLAGARATGEASPSPYLHSAAMQPPHVNGSVTRAE